MKKITIIILALIISVGAFSQSRIAQKSRNSVEKSKHYDKKQHSESKDVLNVKKVRTKNPSTIAVANHSSFVYNKSIQAVEDTLALCNIDSLVGGVGYNGAGEWTCSIKLTSAMLAPYIGKAILGVVAGISDAASTTSISAHIITDSASYNGLNPALAGTTVTGVVDGWNEAPISMIINGSDLWVGYHIIATAGYPSSTDGQANIENADLITDGAWASLAGYGITGNWNIMVLVGTATGCLQPNSLSVSNITNNSADLAWGTGGATAWNIEYGTAGFTQGAGTTIAVTTNPYTLTGLTPGNYEFYVQDDCGATQSAWTGPVSFSVTNCASPACYFYFTMNDTYGDGWNGATLDVLEDGIIVATLTGPATDTATDSVGVCGTGTLELVWNKGSWDSEINFSVTSPFSTVIYEIVDPATATPLVDGVAFYTGSSSCTPPACPNPTTLAASNITGTSADITWVEAGTATLWDIEYGVQGFTPTGIPTTAGLTAQTTSLTSLTSQTSYDVYVRADCGSDQSIWTGPVTFMTSCGASSSLPYTEGFEGATFPPTCWSILDANSDLKTWVSAAATYANSGAKAASYSYSTTLPADDWLFSGGLNLQASTNYTLSFYYRARSATYAESLKASIGTANNATAMTTTIVDIPGFIDITYVLSETSFTVPTTGVYYVGFQAYSDADMWNLYIDDVTIDVASSCAKPTNLSAGSATTTSASLSWTNGGSETAWNIEYGVAGFTQGTGTTVAVSTNPYTLSGLTSSTSYSYYIQADCSSSQSIWTGPFTFATSCGITNTFPWNESFEGGIVPPACWSSVDADGDALNWEVVIDTDGYTIQDGSYAAMSASYTTVAITPDNYLITPQFTIAQNNLEFKYWVATQDGGWPSENYSVLVSTTGTATTDFTEIYNETLTADDTTWREVKLPLATYNGQNIYLAFRHWNSTDWFQMKIDNVSIDYTTGIAKVESNNINIYPNPTTGIVNIKNTENSNVYVYNVLGDVVATFNNLSKVSKIDLSNLSEGNYVIKVVSEKETVNKHITIVK